MSKQRKIIFILLGLLLVVLLLAVLKGGSGSAIELETQQVSRDEIVATVSASGKIFPVEEVVIIPEIAGEVIKLYVTEGDSVKEGDMLAKINPNIYQDAVRRAEASVLTAKANLGNAKARYQMSKAQYRRTESEYKRQKSLHEQGVISDSEYETALANYEVAQSELKAAEESVEAAKYGVQSAEATLQESKNNLLRTIIYSPMSGIVTGLNVEEGKVVGGINTFSATEMMRISNLNDMEVRVDVNENDVLNINLGDTALIDVEAYDDREFKGIVTQISSSAANSGSQQLTTEQVSNFTVKIYFLPSSFQDIAQSTTGKFPFLPGMSATTDIITERKKDILVVPIEAVTTRKEDTPDSTGSKMGRDDDYKEVVFVINDGKAEMRKVNTGIQDDRHIEIKDGLEEGEWIAVGPYTIVQQILDDGDEVKSKEKKSKEK